MLNTEAWLVATILGRLIYRKPTNKQAATKQGHKGNEEALQVVRRGT